jgi:hypothetical protein
MDADRFDALSRSLAAVGSRRRAVAALFGGALVASSGLAADAKRRGRGRRNGGRVQAQTHANGGEHGSTRTTICHQPGTPDEKTLEVDDNALQGHLEHGDTDGPCGASGASCPALTDSGVECACVSTPNREFACAYTYCSGVVFDDTCLDPNHPCPVDSVCAANPCCGTGVGFGCLSLCTDLIDCTCTAAPQTCDPEQIQACGIVAS